MSENTTVVGSSGAVEDLSVFDKWLEEEVAVPFPACLNEPLVKKTTSNKNNSAAGSSQRSRMFVNSNREHGGKPKVATKDKKENNTPEPSNAFISWDTPIFPDAVPKMCLTDKEFAAAVRVIKEPSPEDNDSAENCNDNCPHFIIHSQCYCDSTCTVGVCTNCFLVFCNPICLKGALRRGGKVADVSKAKLEQQPFGFSRQNFTKPFVLEKSSEATDSSRKIEPKENSAATSDLSTAAVEPPTTNVKNSKDLTDAKLLGENKKRPGRGRGRSTLPFGSDTTIIPQPLVKAANSPPKSSMSQRGGAGGKRNAPTSRNAATSRPTGIFSHVHGYRETYGEMTSMNQSTSSYGASLISDRYELGGKGHFDGRLAGPAKIFPHEDFPTATSLIVGRSRGRGAVRYNESQVSSVGYPHHGIPIEPLIHSDKILRDPVASFFGTRSDPSNAPVYRGHVNAQPSAPSKPAAKPKNPFLTNKPSNKAENTTQVTKVKKKKTSIGSADSETVRLHGNVQVKLTTPMKGAYDSYDDSNRRPFTETNADLQDSDHVPLRPRRERAELTSDSGEEENATVPEKTATVMSHSKGLSSDSDDGVEEREVELLRLQSKTGVHDSAEDSECDRRVNQNESKKDYNNIGIELIKTVPALWDEIDRIHRAEEEDELVTASEDHELNGLTKELDLLSMGGKKEENKKNRRPIDEEMEVPLGVFVIVRPTCIVDANRMYLRWDDEKVISRDVDMSALQKIKLVKMNSMKVEDYCIVQYEGDIINNSGRQRAEITRLVNTTHPTVRVRLIDIGLEEEFSPEGVFVLPPEFLSQRRLCFRFGLLRYLQVHLETAVNGMQEYLERIFSLYRTGIRVDALLPPTVGRTRHWGEIFCFDASQNVRQYLLDSSYVTECTAKDRLRKISQFFQMATLRNAAHERNNFGLDEAEAVYICPNATSYNNFYVIRMAEMDIKSDIEDRLNRYASLTVDPYAPWQLGFGDLCLAIVSQEKTELLRAQVAFIEQGEAVGRLIDVGRLIRIRLNSLREMPKALCEIRAIALACSLPVELAPGKAHYSTEVLQKLDRLNVVLGQSREVIAHALPPTTASVNEVELVIAPKNRASSDRISFSESLVNDGGAVWKTKDFMKDVLYPHILQKELPEDESSSATESDVAED